MYYLIYKIWVFYDIFKYELIIVRRLRKWEKNLKKAIIIIGLLGMFILSVNVMEVKNKEKNSQSINIKNNVRQIKKFLIFVKT